MEKQSLIQFRNDVKRYRDLLSSSAGPLLDIEKNHQQIEKLQSTLITQFAELEDTINQYSQRPLYIDPVWRIQVSAYDTALSRDILLRRGPALESVLNDLDYIIAKVGSKKKKTEDKTAPILSFDNLHPKVREHCESRFLSGHYSDAILTAYKVVLNEIKLITGLDDDGKPLVEKAFSLHNPVIKLNKLSSQSDKDEQIGFMLLYSGAALGIRNPKAHDLVSQEDPIRTLMYLNFASLLMQRLDERVAPK